MTTEADIQTNARIIVAKCAAIIGEGGKDSNVLGGLSTEQIKAVFWAALTRGALAQTTAESSDAAQPWHEEATAMRHVGSAAMRLINLSAPKESPGPAEVLLREATRIYGPDGAHGLVAWPNYDDGGAFLSPT